MNNPNKISWYYLCLNHNQYIKELLFNKFTYKTNYISNTHDSELLYINWKNGNNPNMYKMDYNKMKLNLEYMSFEEELIKEVYHPKRVCKYIEQGYDIEDYL